MTPLNESLVPKSKEAEILGIPITYGSLDLDTPEGLSDGEMERIYHEVMDRSPGIIPRLKRLIERYPEFPTLRNYLRVSFVLAGQMRQARQVQKEILAKHPDYLFGKVTAVSDALEMGNSREARKIFGEDLNLAKLYPARDVFHASEVKNFYAGVANLYCVEDRIEEAVEVLNALGKLVPGDGVLVQIESWLMIARTRRFTRRMQEDGKKRISVKASIPVRKITRRKPPEFHHPEIAALYEWDFDLPKAEMDAILALPKATLVEDLIRVLDDAMVRTPWFRSSAADDEFSYFAIHALYFLAEIPAPEALGMVLKFMEQGFEILDFWLVDLSYDLPLSRICDGRLDEVMAWLKAPGIDTSGKSRLVTAVETLALRDPARREEIIGFLVVLGDFLLGCEPGDNIVDSDLCGEIVSGLIDLRAVESRPLIERMWEKGYLLESFVGNLDEILEDLAKPAKPWKRRELPLAETYRQLSLQESRAGEEPEPPELENRGMDDPLPWDPMPWDPMPGEPSNVTAMPGRNDPCYCGSGRKFKKCCMAK